MVKLTTAFLIFFATVAVAEDSSFNAKSLRDRLNGDAATKQRAADRFKASRGNHKSLKLLNEDSLTYKLPNGRYVKGTMLPNGKVAPALVDSFGNRTPACVTRQHKLVKGVFNNDSGLIECKLDPSELAIIEGQKASSKTQKKSAKYGGSGATTAKKRVKPKPKPIPVDPNIYTPPARNAQGGSNTIAGVMSYNKHEFGVPIGSWVKARLLRSVSSAESGMIEFQTLEDIEGKRQVFPKGTILFARKQINEGQKRLESQTMTSRLPNGDEVQGIEFVVYSMDKTAGLHGTLVRDRDGELTAASTGAALAAVGTAAVSSSNQAAGAAADSFSGDLIGNERRYAPNTPSAIIKVSPQNVMLQSVKSF